MENLIWTDHLIDDFAKQEGFESNKTYQLADYKEDFLRFCNLKDLTSTDADFTKHSRWRLNIKTPSTFIFTRKYDMIKFRVNDSNHFHEYSDRSTMAYSYVEEINTAISSIQCFTIEDSPFLPGAYTDTENINKLANIIQRPEYIWPLNYTPSAIYTIPRYAIQDNCIRFYGQLKTSAPSTNLYYHNRGGQGLNYLNFHSNNAEAFNFISKYPLVIYSQYAERELMLEENNTTITKNTYDKSYFCHLNLVVVTVQEYNTGTNQYTYQYPLEEDEILIRFHRTITQDGPITFWDLFDETNPIQIYPNFKAHGSQYYAELGGPGSGDSHSQKFEIRLSSFAPIDKIEKYVYNGTQGEWQTIPASEWSKYMTGLIERRTYDFKKTEGLNIQKKSNNEAYSLLGGTDGTKTNWTYHIKSTVDEFKNTKEPAINYTTNIGISDITVSQEYGTYTYETSWMFEIQWSMNHPCSGLIPSGSSNQIPFFEGENIQYTYTHDWLKQTPTKDESIEGVGKLSAWHKNLPGGYQTDGFYISVTDTSSKTVIWDINDQRMNWISPSSVSNEWEGLAVIKKPIETIYGNLKIINYAIATTSILYNDNDFDINCKLDITGENGSSTYLPGSKYEKLNYEIRIPAHGTWSPTANIPLDNTGTSTLLRGRLQAKIVFTYRNVEYTSLGNAISTSIAMPTSVDIQ